MAEIDVPEPAGVVTTESRGCLLIAAFTLIAVPIVILGLLLYATFKN
jgi:ABC-type tungstate transport system substrate-binding protein